MLMSRMGEKWSLNVRFLPDCDGHKSTPTQIAYFGPS